VGKPLLQLSTGSRRCCCMLLLLWQVAEHLLSGLVGRSAPLVVLSCHIVGSADEASLCGQVQVAGCHLLQLRPDTI